MKMTRQWKCRSPRLQVRKGESRVGTRLSFVNPPAGRRSIGSNARAIKEGSDMARTHMIIPIL
jgi:hypothetical protein